MPLRFGFRSKSIGRTRSQGGGVSAPTPYLNMDFQEGTYRFNGVDYATFDLLWTAISGAYVRSGTKRYVGSDKLLATAGANVWPTEYDITTGLLVGKTVRPGVTPLNVDARDFTTGNWAASNVTAAKDETGIDGSANAASSLLATASNGTITQAITSASANRCFDVFVKRLVGTGVIELSVDGGTTYKAITTELVLNEWVRCWVNKTAVTNPSIRIRIGTSGDKIAVDYAKCSTGLTPGAPCLPGETVSADSAIITRTNIPLFTSAAGAAIIEISSDFYNSARSVLSLGSFNSEYFFQADINSGGGIVATARDGGAYPLSITMGGTGHPAFDQRRLPIDHLGVAATWGSSNTIQTCISGYHVAETTMATLGDLVTIRLGQSAAGGIDMDGGIKSLKLYTQKLTTKQLVDASMGRKPFVTWGDSLAAGAGLGVTVSELHHSVLRRGAPSPVYRTFNQRAVGGETSAQALVRWQAATLVTDYTQIIWAGQNDADGSTATIGRFTTWLAAIPHNRWVVYSIPEYLTDSGARLTEKRAIKAWLLANYPSNYFDMNGYLNGFGNGSTDNTAVAAGCVPPSLLDAGGVHFNTAGQALIGAAEITRFTANGW